MNKKTNTQKAITSIQHCTMACKKTVQEMQLAQILEFQTMFEKQTKKHQKALQEVGAIKLVESFMDANIPAFFASLNVILNSPIAKQVVRDITKDMVPFYRKRKAMINKVIACYLKNCDDEALAFTKNIIGCIVGMLNIFGDAEVTKNIAILQGLAKDNAIYAVKLLNKNAV